MPDVKFNLEQTGKPTPQWVNLALKISSVVLAALIVTINASNLMSPVVKNEVSVWIGFLIAILHGIAPFFGVQVDENAKIPASKVDVMETK